MDALASIVFGVVVVNAVKSKALHSLKLLLQPALKQV